MTPEGWVAWLGRVNAAVVVFFGGMGGDDWPAWPEPAALWEGPPAVGVRLAKMATEYKAVENDRKDASKHLWWPHDGPYQDEPSWEAVAPFEDLPPSMLTAYVAYPGPARLAVPPATVVLAAAGWWPAPGELSAAVAAGANELLVGPG
jgi:hypothetical protein